MARAKDTVNHHAAVEQLREAAAAERVAARDIEARLEQAEHDVETHHASIIEALSIGHDGQAASGAKTQAQARADELSQHRAAARLRVTRAQQATDDFAHDNADALLAEVQVEAEQVTAQLNESVGVALAHHRALVEQTREMDRIIAAGGGEPRLDGPSPTHAWQVALHELGRAVQQHPVLEAPRPRWRGRDAAAQRDRVAQFLQDQREGVIA